MQAGAARVLTLLKYIVTGGPRQGTLACRVSSVTRSMTVSLPGAVSGTEKRRPR